MSSHALRSKLTDQLPRVDEAGLYTTLDPHRYVVHRRSQFVNLQGFRGIFCASRMFVLASLLGGYGKFKRRSFDMTSLAPHVLAAAQSARLPVYFIGAKQHEVALAVENITEAYPRLKLVGFRNGYFGSKQDELEAIAEIIRSGARVVVCGMGVPKQEEFLLALWSSGWRGSGFTCGGFLHQTSRQLNYYPRVFDMLELRWLYRVWDEPRILVRLLNTYTRFVVAFMSDVRRDSVKG